MVKLRTGATALLIICMGAAGSAALGDEPESTPEESTAGERKQIHVYRINPHTPTLDGVLDDAVWEKAEWVTDFTQKQPDEGQPAKNETEVAFIYDDEALYVGVRCHSADPDGIRSTVSRRDHPGNSERIIVSFDTYRDLRTAYTFSVTVSGTRVDAYHPSDNEGGADHGWDPVWSAKTARTSDGWTAEMRIPFTQLRFNNRDQQVWGVNINRWVPSMSEDSFWIVVPKNESGWSSRMGDLLGIEGIRPSRRIELLPYVSSDVLMSDRAEPEDPFTDGRDANVGVGGDFRMGVGPNLTLEGTVNPDFGQVEADPAVVNLSAFEVFFPEKRPFFTEGSQLFSGGGAGYFYSRRIGAPPHGWPSGDYVDVPRNTSIVGAAKLTGRTGGGLNVGLLTAFTANEYARGFDTSTGVTTEERVEPRTGWGVVRLEQEVFGNGSTAGIIATGVERDLSAGDGLEDFLRKRAYTGGVDFNLRLAGGRYRLRGDAGYSYIQGTAAAIERSQRSSARFFQRPDVDYVSLDPTRTSLQGWKATGRIEKAEGSWLWNAGAGAESPEFELNDIGSLNTADDIDAWGGMQYRQNKPGSFYQSWWAGAWTGAGWNFGRDRQFSYIDIESSVTLKNFYGIWTSFEYFPSAQSDNLTRGGVSMGTAASWDVDLNLWSHSRGRLSWWAWGSVEGDELDGAKREAEVGMTYRPGSRWELSFTPRYYYLDNPRQYVEVEDGGSPATYGQRYVFSFIERSEIAAVTRLNYSFTPDLTLEGYIEPFAASGRYYGHGELEAARSKYLRTYGTDGTTITREADGSYTVTDGSDTFTIPNLDFNVVSFRSNVVLRWEWSPGSTLYVVWQQNRADGERNGDLVGISNLGDAFRAEGDNFFALKITYWIPFS